jgi:hypothetical protein
MPKLKHHERVGEWIQKVVDAENLFKRSPLPKGWTEQRMIAVLAERGYRIYHPGSNEDLRNHPAYGT